jgi:hypothetical protein
MNLIELVSFLLTIFLSVLLGRSFYRHVGWWGAGPGILLGFGSIIGFWKVVRAGEKLPTK